MYVYLHIYITVPDDATPMGRIPQSTGFTF